MEMKNQFWIVITWLEVIAIQINQWLLIAAAYEK